MRITQEAQPVLADLLKEKEADGLMMEVHESCCGKTPIFALVVFDKEDKPETIDGIKVLIPEDLKPVAEQVVLDLVDGQLVVMAPEMEGCGCHHEHDHEDGCCGGHGHEHDHGEGCCGHHGHDHDGGCCHGH